MIDEIRRILQSGVCLSDFSDKCKNDGACKKCENEALEKLIADHDKQIREEVIDEYKKALLQAFNETNINDYGFYPQNVVDMVAIKLKEQK